MDRAHDTDVFNRLVRPSGSRRYLMVSALTAMVLGGNAPHATQAGNRKKKKQKHKKQEEQVPGYALWEGRWNTTLSNGVKGVATFSEPDPLFGAINGVYTNSVGSGRFNCFVTGEQGESLRCEYEQDSDGTSGGFSITLTSKNRWFGNYFTDTGGSGTWEGVPR
ncbi:MAG: hypothetical protein U0Z70_14095 [Thermomicrobiales bacterium]